LIRFREVMKLLSLLIVVSLAQAQFAVNVTGRWQWRGVAGWQRIELNLKSEGSRVSGTMRIGPGGDEPATPEDFWEYFFDAVDFKISDGTISGNQIRFEQSVGRLSGRRSAPGPAATTRYLYKGTVEGDEIAMTREVVPDKKDPWSLGNQRIEFVVKRVN